MSSYLAGKLLYFLDIFSNASKAPKICLNNCKYFKAKYDFCSTFYFPYVNNYDYDNILNICFYILVRHIWLILTAIKYKKS